MRIGFLGAGRWGMALGMLLDRKGRKVTMWEKNPERLARLRTDRTVPDLPPTALIPDSVILTDSIADAVRDADAVVLALPTQALRENLGLLRGKLTSNPIVVSVMKGIEISTRKRVSEIIKEFLPRTRIAVLTGPGIPYDVAKGDPTSLVVASAVEDVSQTIRDSFSAENLRIYSSSDLVGAELGGALKNVTIIAAGIADGIGLGLNAKSALLTRGLYEITRLGVCLGANPMTFAGLSGVGDLIVTAFSPRSRNHQFGLAIAQGRTADEAAASLSGVAEGYYTCRAAYDLANRFNVELPITAELHSILYESRSPRESIRKLISRSLKSELWN
jgi:glycerol-3-phosphate dehydrogenase (NAD(P)+)